MTLPQGRQPAQPLPQQALRDFDDTAYEQGPSRHLEHLVEGGCVLRFPHMPFVLREGEARFLDPRWSNGNAKNISLRGSGELRGAQGEAADLQALRALIERFALQSAQLVDRLFPQYRGKLRPGNASLRPFEVETRDRSWRQDDTRLHVDAFPSNPMRGVRLLRVFTNVHPGARARQWRVGEAFGDFALRFAPRLRPPVPGSARLLRLLRVTKAVRTPYDHAMLQLHDLAKADLDYQRDAPQAAVDFTPGSTWVVFSDQVLHAVMGGQHMMEQTFYLHPDDQLVPSTAPLRVLERLLGHELGVPARHP
ncbi:MAG: Kdo hydroxylase family protein [Betaproteobacteria bacterium]|nr:Kdo hydroxylase family protein [Betaproteobacteria bacterium]MBU6512001.1 Kdo hydroxylase family protein [Betaproteobacteria bacterium]MDE1955283.1 Kdo hydroxylase family protein [Betaproteobacteria bacterium]MDE2151466.1 Kdo hydroxylase family protein [Betaproteobacteria bacterium]MDE2479929.1 Kdo hydroxylase family protein [Betaproteobacteria bacterium]